MTLRLGLHEICELTSCVTSVHAGCSSIKLYSSRRQPNYAEGYPHAYLQHQGFQYSFRRSALYDGRIVADVVITPLKKV